MTTIHTIRVRDLQEMLQQFGAHEKITIESDYNPKSDVIAQANKNFDAINKVLLVDEPHESKSISEQLEFYRDALTDIRNIMEGFEGIDDDDIALDLYIDRIVPGPNGAVIKAVN